MTAGGLLKEARQAAGMHIAALAVALKVPVSKLEALEADNFTVLPDTVFVRARKGEFDGVLTMYHDQGQIAIQQGRGERNFEHELAERARTR